MSNSGIPIVSDVAKAAGKVFKGVSNLVSGVGLASW